MVEVGYNKKKKINEREEEEEEVRAKWKCVPVDRLRTGYYYHRGEIVSCPRL